MKKLVIPALLSLILAACSSTGTDTGGRGVLSAVSTDGRIRQRLTVQAADVREPAWGPQIR